MSVCLTRFSSFNVCDACGPTRAFNACDSYGTTRANVSSSVRHHSPQLEVGEVVQDAVHVMKDAGHVRQGGRRVPQGDDHVLQEAGANN
jgi:hypothetical protein